jgi:thioredoxin 1
MIMSDKITYLTDENFESVLSGAKAAVVDFYADWCGPCMSMVSLYDQLADEYDGKVVFCKVNTDDQKRLAIKNKVMSIPCFMFYKNGAMTERHDGTMAEIDFKKKLDAIL